MARAYRALQTNKLLLREMKQVRRQFNRNLTKGTQLKAAEEEEEMEGEMGYSSCTWVPHPRTGIYFPKGHEWVMRDVPPSAASFEEAFWLRSSDGADEPNPNDESSFGSSRFSSVFDQNSPI